MNIQSEAKRKNQEWGITSVLIVMKGVVFQLLEGSKESVTTLMDEIRKDARHNNISIVFNQSTEDRLFGAPIYILGQHTARRHDVQQKIYAECADTLQVKTQRDITRFKLVFGAIVDSTITTSSTGPNHPNNKDKNT